MLTQYLDALFSRYGYGVVGIVVMLESMGLPLPAESLIITAAIYCATTHHLDIHWVAVAAVSGAIMGDNFGYLIGRAVGLKVLQKYGRKIGLTPDRILLGRHLFRKRGGIIVFFGRFIAILRIFVALLAGASHMRWYTFLLFNALGGVIWAGGYTYGAYYLGSQILEVTGPVAIVVACIGGGALLAGFLFIRKNEKKFLSEALKEAHFEQDNQQL